MEPTRVINKFNPGGIKATLERWYADPAQQNRWVVFDGVSVILVDSLENCPHRSICLVSELGTLVDGTITTNELLYNDY